MSTIVLALALLTASIAPASGASCDPTGADAAAIAAARADVASQCDCATAVSHGAYTSCAAGVVKTRVDDGLLNRACAGAVKRCAARSTCGHPGFVTCCRTSRKGKKSCSIKRDPALCRAPSGGSASVGTAPSCCDACGGGSTEPVCGNGVVEAGETCDESDAVFPSQQCPHSDAKLRCAKPGMAGACQRCCGRSPGDGPTAGALCTSAADTSCCGFCARFGSGMRCVDCKDEACSCGVTGDPCNDTSCCPGYACSPVDTFPHTCCALAGTGCGSGGDCCSGSCSAGACD